MMTLVWHGGVKDCMHLFPYSSSILYEDEEKVRLSD